MKLNKEDLNININPNHALCLSQVVSECAKKYLVLKGKHLVVA